MGVNKITDLSLLQKTFPIQTLLSTVIEEPIITTFEQFKKVFDVILDGPICKTDLQQKLFKMVLESHMSFSEMNLLNSQLLDNLSHFASQSAKLSKRNSLQQMYCQMIC